MAKPLPVTLMHCCAEVPQRLFITTYRPPMVVAPYCSQICVSAWAGPAATNAAIEAAASRVAAVTARMTRLMTAPEGGDPRGRGWCGSAPTQRTTHSQACEVLPGSFVNLARWRACRAAASPVSAGPRRPAATNGPDDLHGMISATCSADNLRTPAVKDRMNTQEFS